jgi:hypothetical protein
MTLPEMTVHEIAHDTPFRDTGLSSIKLTTPLITVQNEFASRGTTT